MTRQPVRDANPHHGVKVVGQVGEQGGHVARFKEPLAGALNVERRERRAVLETLGSDRERERAAQISQLLLNCGERRAFGSPGVGIGG
jgi:hypothetical protein